MNKIIQEDAKYIGRDFPAELIEYSKTQGSFVYDAKGNKYIDFLMGWNIGNVGWGVKEIREVIKNYNGPDYVNPSSLYAPWVELAKILISITPGKMAKVFRATGGTEAVEIALQAAMSYTKRTKFISIEGSYHGHSIGAMSIGMSYFRTQYSNLLPNCYKIDPPLDVRAAEKVVNLLKNRDIAAYISEPIINNLGVVIPTPEFYQIVSQACKKTGTLFIMDEVATGFGRTGILFASEHYNLQPDILCLGKALTGGYAAMGATLMTEEIAKSMQWNFSFYSTFGWHPLNTNVTIANLKYLLKHQKKILNNVNKMEKFFQNKLTKIKYKMPTNIRIKGLAIGIEFEKSDYVYEVKKRCLKNGLIVSELGNKILTFFPALTIDKQTAEDGLKIFEKSL